MFPCETKSQATFHFVAFLLFNIYFWFCLYIGAFELDFISGFLLLVIGAQPLIYLKERNRLSVVTPANDVQVNQLDRRRFHVTLPVSLRSSAMARVAKYGIDEVLNATILTPDGLKKKSRNKRNTHIYKEFLGHPINMTSQRYQLFKTKGCKCVECGVEGAYFTLDRVFINSKRKDLGPSYHFNLYALRADGSEVLMTKDHIIPKSKNGPDTLENYQPMCQDCNLKKGNLTD